MNTPQEITAIFLRENFRFSNSDGDVIIGDIRLVDGPCPDKHDDYEPGLAVKGPINGHELRSQLPYRFFGRWTTYRNKRTGQTQNQFAYQSFVPAAPADKAGILAYLTRHGAGLGIGIRRAHQLYEAFGNDAVKVCREEPDRAAAAVSQWRADQAAVLSERLQKQAHIEQCSIDLIGLLDKRGLPRATAKKALDLWGNAAADFIRRNPYVLMQFRGCGFKRCDAMYLDLGLPAGKLKRQALCAWHTIASDSNGDTWFPVEAAMNGIRRNVAGCDLRIGDALRLAKRASALAFQRSEGGLSHQRLVDSGGKLWVAETKKADHERFVAEQLAAAESEPATWPEIVAAAGEDEPGPTAHQADNLAKACQGCIGILGGSPGTGKTYTAAALILALINEHGGDDVAVAAPTGKAAVRITEALGQYCVPLRAMTIHSLLRVDPLAGGSGGWVFYYREGRPLPLKYLIVDESSMIDTDLMSSLLAARGKGMHILFVGDVNQLPPVGHGAPLRDMIAARLPYGELTEIRRNSGRIVKTCAAIRDQQSWSCSPWGPEPEKWEAGENLYVLNSPKEPEAVKQGILKLVNACEHHGFDPIWDVQVLTAVNAKSELARKPLNKALQAHLNPQSAIPGTPFRVNDKIVNTKNGWFKSDDEEAARENPNVQLNDAGEVYAANGDLAEVVEIQDKLLLVKLSVGGVTIRIPRGKATEEEDAVADGDPDPEADRTPKTGCSWDLAYALSVHKSQGSEWPVVAVVLDEYPGAMRISDRAWIYTAISRAKKLCLLIGKEAIAKRMCAKNSISKRKTFLAERIDQIRCEQLVEVL